MPCCCRQARIVKNRCACIVKNKAQKVKKSFCLNLNYSVKFPGLFQRFPLILSVSIAIKVFVIKKFIRYGCA